MIRRSPEIEAVVRRWNKAVQTKDGPTLTNMLSMSEHLRYQGTADQECWSGQLFRKGFAEHASEVPDFGWDEHSLEAFENGETGWAHCHATLTFPWNGKSMLHRFTFVLCLEDGTWRMLQLHVSNPIANLEKMGVEHKALDRLIAAAREGFRQDQREGMASVMFTDIVQSSALAQLLGDRAWADRVKAHFDMIGNAVKDAGGKFVKSLGDGTMSTFGSAGAALQAALAVQRLNALSKGEPHLSLRIGLHTGDVIQTEDDFFGTVVNKAARIATIAKPGEIQVSDATRIMVGGASDFSFSGPEMVRLKGLEGDHPIYRLDW